MQTTKLSSKGQVIIPKELRTRRRWMTGLELETIETDEGVLLKPISPFTITTLREVTSCLTYSGKPKSLKEMEEAIKKGAKDEKLNRR
jgi:AbrB family looped-hinge helix DNA binding protein